MNCLARVVVTVIPAPGSTGLDMELPAFLPSRELAEQLLETLRAINPGAFGDITEIQLHGNGGILEEETTLAAAGIWDGGILTLSIKRGEVVA